MKTLYTFCLFFISFSSFAQDGPCPDSVFIPNALTKETDCYRMEVFGAEMHDFTMSVYNRWGQGLFMSEDPNKCWDGTGEKDAQLPSGVYVWAVTYTCESEKKEYKGNLTILR